MIRLAALALVAEVAVYDWLLPGLRLRSWHISNVYVGSDFLRSQIRSHGIGSLYLRPWLPEPASVQSFAVVVREDSETSSNGQGYQQVQLLLSETLQR
jgi:hypothetical protein